MRLLIFGNDCITYPGEIPRFSHAIISLSLDQALSTANSWGSKQKVELNFYSYKEITSRSGYQLMFCLTQFRLAEEKKNPWSN